MICEFFFRSSLFNLLHDFNIWQVHITSQNRIHIPFGVGMASDPMSMRRGGKKLSMEDVCYYQWPLPGLDQVLNL